MSSTTDGSTLIRLEHVIIVIREAAMHVEPEVGLSGGGDIGADKSEFKILADPPSCRGAGNAIESVFMVLDRVAQSRWMDTTECFCG